MIISIVGAALAAAPVATTPASTPMPAMEHHDMAVKDKAEMKDCCKDGCACCKHDGDHKAEPAAH
jgi:hypothetical protein